LLNAANPSINCFTKKKAVRCYCSPLFLFCCSLKLLRLGGGEGGGLLGVLGSRGLLGGGGLGGGLLEGLGGGGISSILCTGAGEGDGLLDRLLDGLSRGLCCGGSTPTLAHLKTGPKCSCMSTDSSYSGNNIMNNNFKNKNITNCWGIWFE